MVDFSPVQLAGICDTVLKELQQQARLQGGLRLAVVGGVVRDALLHHNQCDPRRDLLDVDLVVEGSAETLAIALRNRLGEQRVQQLRVHTSYGTVQMVLDGVVLDLAQSRKESYPAPGENPLVQPGSLTTDLARRDFSINAMALVLSEVGPELELLDFHGGQKDLLVRQLNFLHLESVQDDPTRVVRGARYAARLNFSLSPKALDQVQLTIADWPWPWTPGDSLAAVPPALGTRLRMEFDLLFAREPWRQALRHLQDWGGLSLLDQQLQNDKLLLRHLHRAERLALPLLFALVAVSGSPSALAKRLQLPLHQQVWIEQRVEFQAWLRENVLSSAWQGWSAARWTETLEAKSWSAEVVAIEVALVNPCWRPLLRWWGRWRHVKPPQTARELIAKGFQPGPLLGKELRRLRLESLELQR